MTSGQGNTDIDPQLLLFVQSTPGALALLDADLHFLAASQQFVTDFAPGLDLRGREFSTVFADPGSTSLQRRALQGERVRTELGAMVDAEGRCHYVRSEVRPWFRPDETVGGVVMLVEDVTDKITREHEYRRAHALLIETESVSGVGGWEYLVLEDSLYWTPQCFRIHGVAEDDPTPNIDQALDCYHPDDRGRVSHAVQAAINACEPFDLVARLQRRDGTEIIVRTIGRPTIQNDEVETLVGSIENITSERVSALQAERHRAMLDAVTDSSRDAIFVKDIGGRFQLVNPMMAQYLGKSPEEVLGQSELQDPDVSYDFTEADERVMWRRESETSDDRVETALGARVFETTKTPWILSDGSLVGMIGVARDVTEYRDAIETLRHNEERVRIALEAAHAGLWDWRVQANDFYFDANWEHLLGYEDGELEREFATWERLCHPEDLSRVRQEIDDWIEGRSEHFANEHRLRRKDGRWTWMFGIGRIVERDADGRPLRVVGVQIDVQERREWEDQLAQAKEQAVAASRAKSEFLANMSHEIRTPMTAILGYAELLSDESLTAERRRDAIDTIQRNGDHLLAIINDVLDLSKIEAGQMTLESVEVRPHELALGVTDLFRVRAEGKGIELSFEPRFPLPDRIVSDPVRLRQILSNLVGNAVKFTERGSVRVVLSSGRNDPDELCFAVEDTGIGMSEQQRARLFRAFAQGDTSTTRRFGGTGLGLSISKRLAEMLGGEIEIESEVGRGTTFQLVLRAERMPGATTLLGELCEVQTPQTAAETPVAIDLSGHEILLAEDGPDNQRLISFVLRKAGAEVEIAGNGKIAVERALDHEFDLVLMDMQMPELDGYEATTRLREEGVNIPIIALTAHAMPGDREKCLEAGCDDFGSKPIDRQSLLELCSRWIAVGRSAPR